MKPSAADKSGAISHGVGRLLGVAAAAMLSRKITPAANQQISLCADDFNKLVRLEARGLESGLPESSLIASAPSIGGLLSLLETADSDALVVEAKRIRSQMKPLLSAAKERLAGLGK